MRPMSSKIMQKIGKILTAIFEEMRLIVLYNHAQQNKYTMDLG